MPRPFIGPKKLDLIKTFWMSQKPNFSKVQRADLTCDVIRKSIRLC